MMNNTNTDGESCLNMQCNLNVTSHIEIDLEKKLLLASDFM